MKTRQIKITLPENVAEILERKAHARGIKLATLVGQIVLHSNQRDEKADLMQKQINDLHAKFFEQD